MGGFEDPLLLLSCILPIHTLPISCKQKVTIQTHTLPPQLLKAAYWGRIFCLPHNSINFTCSLSGAQNGGRGKVLDMGIRAIMHRYSAKLANAFKSTGISEL